VLHQLPAARGAYLTGHSFFPALISPSFSRGLTVAFGFAAAMCVIAALASLLRGGKYVHRADAPAGTESGRLAGPESGPAADVLPSPAAGAGSVLAADAGSVPAADAQSVLAAGPELERVIR
jgi:hypothetical protein